MMHAVSTATRSSEKEDNNIMMTTEDIRKQFDEECEKIALQCEAEGYPSHGSNYDLRVDNLMKSYPELFGEEEV